MKAVMISIRPKWVEKIIRGEKTVEVRKTAPKLKPPFKCYIYCTFPKKPIYTLWLNRGKDTKFLADGKVVGEFTCDNVSEIKPHDDGNGSCLSFNQLNDYLKGGKGYAWHISDLKIYDKPKEIREFKCECDGDCYILKSGVGAIKKVCSKIKEYHKTRNENIKIFSECDCILPLSRAPQSWCYVEIPRL